MKITPVVLAALMSAAMFGQAAKPSTKSNPATPGRVIAQPDQSNSGDKRAQDVRKLIELYEREMIESERKHNWETIARRLASDFLEIAGDGKAYNKDQVAAYFPDIGLNKYAISEMEVRIIDANAAIVAYRIAVDATFKGQPVPGAARVSSVWARQNGAWMMKFHQSTPIPK
jgi:hypothetical protein